MALNCKGEALGMIKALAAADESTRGVAAWYRLFRDVGRIFQHQRCLKISDIPSHPELWESRIGEYEKWVFKNREYPDKMCLTVARYSSFAAWCPKIWKRICSTFTLQRTTRRKKSTFLEQASLKETPISTTKGNTTNLFPWRLMHCLQR